MDALFSTSCDNMCKDGAVVDGGGLRWCGVGRYNDRYIGLTVLTAVCFAAPAQTRIRKRHPWTNGFINRPHYFIAALS